MIKRKIVIDTGQKRENGTNRIVNYITHQGVS